MVGILVFSHGFAGSERLKLSGIGWLFTGGGEGIRESWLDPGSGSFHLQFVLFLSGFGHPLPRRRNIQASVTLQGLDPRRERPATSVIVGVPSKNPDCRLGVGLELYDLSYPEVPSSSEA